MVDQAKSSDGVKVVVSGGVELLRAVPEPGPAVEVGQTGPGPVHLSPFAARSYPDAARRVSGDREGRMSDE